MASDQTTQPDSATDPPSIDRAAIKRRRRLLYGFAVAALTAVIVFSAFQLFSEDDKKAADKNQLKPPVILERFELKPVGGQSGRGLAELVRREKNDGLRVLAVKLRPTLDGQVYQLLLAGGRREPKLLGNQIVGAGKTFVGEAKINTSELRKYRRIELRRVGQGNPPPSRLVLRGTIPR